MNCQRCEGLLALVDQLRQQLEVQVKEKGQWKEAAYKKPRTWEAIQGMAKAGDGYEELAANYGVPVEWVRFIMFPECDLDARYGRPSDRTHTAKAHALEAEREKLKSEEACARLRTALEAFLEKWPSVEQAVNGVLGLQAARGYPYTGPNIGKEIEQMRAALALPDDGAESLTHKEKKDRKA